MAYRDSDDTFTVYGIIPGVFHWVRAPHNYIFTQGEIFTVTFMAWFYFRWDMNWAAQLFRMTETIPPSHALGITERKYTELVDDIFSRVNERKDDIADFFWGIFEGRLNDDSRVKNVNYHGDEFRITVKENYAYLG